MTKIRWQDYLFLHGIVFLYSLTALCSKFAAKQDFLSGRFILFYGLVLLGLAAYAVLWQQVLKKMPLTTAFANKAATVVWGMLLGVLVFKEQISLNMVLGALIVLTGIFFVVKQDG